MGNCENSQIAQLKREMQFVQVLADGSVIYKSKWTSQFIIRHVIQFKTQTAHLKTYLQFWNKLKKGNNSSITKIHGIQQISIENLCGKQYRQVHIYTAYYNYTLEEFIRRKYYNLQGFEESQVWYLLRELVTFGQFLQRFSIRFNLLPKNLLLTPQGKIRINLHKAWAYQQSKPISKISPLEQHYYSPQQLQHLKLHKTQQGYNSIFSIGIIILNCIYPASLDRIYDYQKWGICQRVIQKGLAGNKYSRVLIQVVQKMVSFDFQSRPSYPQILTLIQRNQQKQEIEVEDSITLLRRPKKSQSPTNTQKTHQSDRISQYFNKRQYNLNKYFPKQNITNK